MDKPILTSIIINNYNYGRFLGQAIESALGQTAVNVEVIVVDDGSTDNSREIIAKYEDSIIPVLKENGGQASALNTGFAASQGAVILFLDADDILLSTAVENVTKFFCDENVVKVHWQLCVVDENCRKTGRVFPGGNLPEGNLKDIIIQNGPSSTGSSPTSGNAWSREFLEKVMPIPETDYKLCADDYLYALAPAFGVIRQISEPQGLYRVHNNNNHQTKTLEERLEFGLYIQNQQCVVLNKFLQEMGIEAQVENWKKRLWFHRLHLAIQELKALIPPKNTFILVDEDQWGTDQEVFGYRRIPFLERNGQYWGAPPDDDFAIKEIERLRKGGANFIVFAWNAFWWLNHYTGMHHYLNTKFSCILNNEQLIVFDLQSRNPNSNLLKDYIDDH